VKGFGSDNHAGVHPELLKAISDCNTDHAPSYGTDVWTQKANQEFQKIFAKPVSVFFVYNGTSANTLALRSMLKPWQSVLCSDVSHLNMDECGAPEFMTGGKLIPLPSHNGKITLETLKSALIRKGDQHYSQSKVISLTQPTEYGTCYTAEEISEITQWAHSQGLYVHIDGARIANAVHYLQTSFAHLFSDTHVDVISFGGTKNGFMLGEAVVFLNQKLAEDFIYIRKQSGQLPSKTRFISAQFMHYLGSGLWKKIAQHSHEMALLLYNSIKTIPGIEITQPIESNAVFVKIPQKWVKPLREKAFFYVWDEKTFECRLMTSFDTTEEEIHIFTKELQNLSSQHFETKETL